MLGTVNQIIPTSLAGLANLVVYIIILVIILWFLSSAIKIVKEYERAVIFRLGRLLGAKGPGIFFIIPFVDSLRKVDLRVLTFDVPRQMIITKDNVTVQVDAVVYYRVFDPVKAIVQVENYMLSTNLLAQTTLRDILGQVQLDDLLTKREELNQRLQSTLDIPTDAWGIKVTAVVIKDVILPESLQRAMAKQAEAERERRSRIIIAEGEYQAAQKMSEAAELYKKTPIALRLREFQMISEVAREKNLILVTSTGGTTVAEFAGLAKALDKKSVSTEK
ncbi:MAG: slipin family protein [Candidatus Verstraetearchaeota archaeon]|nr:slipin family protein [Candidatus Verstraetearchaeota archaeon]